jgi:hypothetical protein
MNCMIGGLSDGAVRSRGAGERMLKVLALDAGGAGVLDRLGNGGLTSSSDICVGS